MIKIPALKIPKLYETVLGFTLIILSIIFYRFPATYFLADLLAIVATVVCGREMVVGAIKGVLKGQLNVAELITIAIIASFALGEYLVAAEVAFIMTVGGYLEERVIDRSRRAIDDLVTLIPNEARLKVAGSEKVVPVEEIKAGDIVLVKPGEEIPVDGTVTAGTSLVSEANITGESKPLGKIPGDTVFAGSLTYDGALEIETEKVGSRSALGRMVELTQTALSEKTPTVRLADRFAAWFTPLVLSLAFLVYVLSGDLIRAIVVLVVMCPCTLVLAIPSALVASLSKSIKNGILPKGGIYLEKAAEVDAIILDKTGTLTFGKPQISSILPLPGVSEDYLLTMAAVAEKHSNHPIAQEIVTVAHKRGLEIPDPETVNLIPGKGMVVKSNGQEIVVSNTGLLSEGEYGKLAQARAIWEDEEKKGRTTFFVAVNNEIKGIVSLEDILRDDTVQSIATLKTIVPRLILLTGDNNDTAYLAAKDTGINEFKARLLPEDKVKILKELRSQGMTVAALGDGINDAPLLAAADVGFAMGDSAAVITLDAGSVILLNGDLSKLPLFIQIARATRRIIKQNIVVFAIIYNLAAFFLASFGYLSPLAGAIVHNVGSTLVVVNSMRLVK